MKVLRSLLEAAVVLAVALGVARWVLGIFSKKTTVYRPTPTRQVALLTWPLLAVGAGFAAAGPGLLAPTAAERWLAWGLLLAVLALAGPALALHLRYYTLNAATTLIFDPTGGRLQVALDEVLAYDPARQGWPGPRARGVEPLPLARRILAALRVPAATLAAGRHHPDLTHAIRYEAAGALPAPLWGNGGGAPPRLGLGLIQRLLS